MFSRLFSARPIIARAGIRIRSGVSNPCRWIAHSSVRIVILCDICINSSLINHSGVLLRQLVELPCFRYSILQRSKQKMQAVSSTSYEIIFLDPIPDCNNPACHDTQEMFRLTTESVSSEFFTVRSVTTREGCKAAFCVYAERKWVHCTRCRW